MAIRGEVGEPHEAESAVALCVERFDRIDILVNNAGFAGRCVPVHQMSNVDWHHVIDVDLHGVFYFCRAAVRAMLPHGFGRIVNVATLAGEEGNPNAPHSSAARAGVIALTKSMGKELATSGILVNAVAPAQLVRDEAGDERVACMTSKIPMQRAGRPEEVAGLIASLCSDHVSSSTGAIYDPRGGRATS
ncbi:MAG: SDR family oxidoreductase [Chloroflexi bacterium]|nr:SDR family oxidoreductase [Chloroflexota bacterium]